MASQGIFGEEWRDIKIKPWAKFMSNEDYAANFDAFLDSVKRGQPWFFWYGAREPHRPYEFMVGHNYRNKDISEIDSVPAYWPDSEIVRNDMLDYATEVEYADWHLGKMMESLEKGVARQYNHLDYIRPWNAISACKSSGI